MRSASGESPIRVLRTEAAHYWLTGGLYGLAILLGLNAAIKDPDSGFWPPTIVVMLILVVHMAWFKTARLTLTSGAIHYRALLHKVDIALSDVVNVEYAVGFVSMSYKPYKRIIVTVREPAKGKNEIILNAGLFAPREIKLWIKECNRVLAV